MHWLSFILPDYVPEIHVPPHLKKQFSTMYALNQCKHYSHNYHIFQLKCNFAFIVCRTLLKNITLADEFPKINIVVFLLCFFFLHISTYFIINWLSMICFSFTYQNESLKDTINTKTHRSFLTLPSYDVRYISTQLPSTPKNIKIFLWLFFL